MMAEMESLNDIITQIDQGSMPLSNAIDSFKTKSKLKFDQMNTNDPQFVKNPDYIEFREAIWEVKNPDKPFPSLEQNDDDIVMRTLMTDPWTTKTCHHTFSGAIIEMIRNNHGTMECPTPGCHERLRISDLISDEKLKRKIARSERARDEAREQAFFNDDII
ncbi:hypothetical protein HDV02_004011 [Globomyces sp. JEL0801]|nr:hypothetical protein HDV02_004011 [Globomyces sp. JEL0801]